MSTRTPTHEDLAGEADPGLDDEAEVPTDVPTQVPTHVPTHVSEGRAHPRRQRPGPDPWAEGPPAASAPEEGKD